MDRRYFLSSAALGAVGAALTACGGGGSESSVLGGAESSSLSNSMTSALSNTIKSRVIVIGGGMAGATVAKYLRLWGDGIAVTLVERMPTYTSNIMSSMVLTGQRSMSSLTYKYDTLRSKYGITTVFGDVVAIDPVGVTVTLGRQARCSRPTASSWRPASVSTTCQVWVLPTRCPTPGRPARRPRCWPTSSNAMTGGVNHNVVLTIPKTPYRCPPGPYERACLVADWLRVNKPGSKLIVLDANPGIVTEVDNFTNAFMGIHGNVIEYHTNAEVTQVDPATMSLYTPARHFPRRCHQHDSTPARRCARCHGGAEQRDRGPLCRRQRLELRQHRVRRRQGSHHR